MKSNVIKPILFSTEMVKAILDGRKTQTRRVVNKEYLGLADIDGNNIYIEDNDGNHFNILETSWAKYKVSDVLYVKETYGLSNNGTIAYKADYSKTDLQVTKNIIKWKPPVHLKQKDARIFLKVTNVRVERLQDIRVRDIEKETGWKREIYSYSNKNRAFYKDYRDLWNLTAKDGYKYLDNPYVFVYDFERIEKQ